MVTSPLFSCSSSGGAIVFKPYQFDGGTAPPVTQDFCSDRSKEASSLNPGYGVIDGKWNEGDEAGSSSGWVGILGTTAEDLFLKCLRRYKPPSREPPLQPQMLTPHMIVTKVNTTKVVTIRIINKATIVPTITPVSVVVPVYSPSESGVTSTGGLPHTVSYVITPSLATFVEVWRPQRPNNGASGVKVHVCLTAPVTNFPLLTVNPS